VDLLLRGLILFLSAIALKADIPFPCLFLPLAIKKKKEEGRRKKEEGRGKREEGRGKSEEGECG
jgi:hypothetical protein